MRSSRVLALLSVGLASEAIYLLGALRLPWWRFGGSLVSWRTILSGASARTPQTSQMAGFAACLAAIAVLAIAYLAGWVVIRRQAMPRWPIWLGAILFAATLFWLQPITADLFVYVSQAHLVTDLGANPFNYAPAAFAGDPLISAYGIQYAARPSVYGPAWILLSLPGTLGRYDVAGGLSYLKGLAAAAYLGCAWLLDRILRRTRPDHALEGLYLFAWNPLVLLMAVGDGHNDIVMMAAVFLALWWLLERRWALAIGSLVLSAWIKWTSLIFVPLFFLYALTSEGTEVWTGLNQRHRLRFSMPQTLLAATAVSALVVAPFGRPDWVIGVVQRFMQPDNWQAAAPGLASLALAAGLLALGAAYAVLVWHFARARRSFLRLTDATFVASLLVLLGGAARAQPWHLVWPASLAGLSTRQWAWPLVIGLSIAMLVAQVWVEWGTPGL